ncbi:DUF3141 domain-containing protein [Halomonas huangheensis]|uniref:3-hydroxyalkanoate synthetase n=1 Tax=Halomonas huangheensis TaxID=1178482 RepID=W1NCI8_9GAMM|nr:DUF3141 domain-containing protein [Halomonas huangheensis]ALM52885.1 3-hydroxyalkanoate synthetase [Halomonas huangheensis]ERL53198.1 hypothetical protein BJB45_18160 [Halomonas huangheensis]
MNALMPQVPEALVSLVDPFGFGRAAVNYWHDAVERNVLYWDVMRQRGNEYLEHIEKSRPSVLGFEADIIMMGEDLPRPVNYELMRVHPPEGVEIDEQARPFVVVDPRAGHGPGIGGFKSDSELGVALRAGHPCYFIAFMPFPVPGQTVEDVVEAEVAFLRHVIELHPESEKPMVVGNCQAGWQIMMAAALEPDVFGPILIAGAPLSYWAGERGKAPMRYTGGMTGGSWATHLLSDLGDGVFDGAWLVQNFERLNPANTWWDKQYQLYANVDTEAERYLRFERWWGGHVVLGGEEIQYIVDNLFLGNRLSTARLVTSDGRRIDLRNVRSPVVVFCSKGDNITPPPQALGWVQDLYGGVEDIQANEQTIVYCVHDTTGHLGIFVSGSVSRKEHAEFTANMDYIDVLPPGLYETRVSTAAERPDAELIEREYLLEFETRDLDDLDEVVKRSDEDERRFATVARVSEINLGLYRQFMQPWVRALSTPESARWMRRMHPSRLGYRLLSDRNPLMTSLPVLADMVRRNRQPLAEDNLFRTFEDILSGQVSSSLDAWRVLRDSAVERLFLDIYGQPVLQSLAGLSGTPEARPRLPGAEPERRRFIERRQQELQTRVAEGGSHEAMMRSMIYVLGGAPATDGRNFRRLQASRAELEPGLRLADFKELLREQFFILKLDKEQALAAIPELLKDQSATEIDAHLAQIEHVLAASGELSERAAQRFERIKALFAKARPATRSRTPRSGGSSSSRNRKATVPASVSESAGKTQATEKKAEMGKAQAAESKASESKAASEKMSDGEPVAEKKAPTRRRAKPAPNQRKS